MASPLLAYANSNSSDGELTGWTNPTRAYVNDGGGLNKFASVNSTTVGLWYGSLFGFDLSGLPDGATITSITISTSIKKNSVPGTFFIGAKFNGSEVGTGASDSSVGSSYEVDTYQPTGLTVANLKSTGSNGFWAIIRAKRDSGSTGAVLFSLDYVACTVEYTESSADELVSKDIATPAPVVSKPTLSVIEVSQDSAAAALFSRRPRKKDDDEVLAIYALLENEW